MGETQGMEKRNGEEVEVEGEGEGEREGEVEEPTVMNSSMVGKRNQEEEEEVTLNVLLNRFLAALLYADPKTSLIQRIKIAVQDTSPSLPEASRNSIRDLLIWTRQGSPLRALLVISVGSIILLAVTGVLVFMVFFLVATTSAVTISLLVSLAAAGGFLAMFFACLATIYVGALMVAAFVISTATISTITVSLIATGWIGFFLTLWLATKKTMDLVRQSLSMTRSTFLAYSATRQVHCLEPVKASD